VGPIGRDRAERATGDSGPPVNGTQQSWRARLEADVLGLHVGTIMARLGRA
jgi:hypothetical protein